MDIFIKMNSLIKNQFIFNAELSTDARIIEDLGTDSFDVINLLINIESTFNIKMPIEAWDNIITVGDIIKYIEEKMIDTE